MDFAALVNSGQTLVGYLDQAGMHPRAAVWVHSSDTDTWRLWIVPPRTVADKHEFYRRLSETISEHRTDLPNIDASDTQMTRDDHPAIRALSRIARVEPFGAISIQSSMYNGVFLSDAIIIRMAL